MREGEEGEGMMVGEGERGTEEEEEGGGGGMR
jgi:hypothetical protein